ncbi:MAG: HAMP domain-containing histidine kinase [Deltaproteobacteria bacterium]|nr:HAMP domain-containing histidine kinase [Deltaproteobacteria bacterium]
MSRPGCRSVFWGELFSAVLAGAVFAAIYSGTGIALVASVFGVLALDYLIVTPGQVFANLNSETRVLIYILVISTVGTAFTELKRGYHALEEAQKEALNARAEAERAAFAREHVIGIVSHDLRNPLASIEMNLELLRRQPGLPDGAAAPIVSVSRSVVRMKRIIDDLLDAVKIEIGAFSVELKPESLRGLVTEAVEPFYSLAAEKKVALDFEVCPPDATLSCDRSRIIQALSNLLQNALKFSSAGGGVRIHAAQVSDEVQFVVTDMGRGIAEGELPHLFERYWRSRSGNGGAGLGLFIVQGIARSHGGWVGVSSVPGVGSRFVLAIPRRARAPGARAA